jgi:hypothetical protein
VSKTKTVEEAKEPTPDSSHLHQLEGQSEMIEDCLGSSMDGAEEEDNGNLTIVPDLVAVMNREMVEEMAIRTEEVTTILEEGVGVVQGKGVGDTIEKNIERTGKNWKSSYPRFECGCNKQSLCGRAKEMG